jgi:ubiquinone/menaquinone biosynthesis C-methylase UbiE
MHAQGRVLYMTQRQQDYYVQTASAYESMHVQPGDEHFIALEYATALLQVVRARSVLDVGSGTGRVSRFLQQQRPDLLIEGVEPIDELREQAQAHGTVLHKASGEDLPFNDDSFDVVMSFALLHHVPDPAPLIKEMMRVARSGIMISDANRFGQGPTAVGLLKLAIHQAGLWPVFERIRTRGRGFMESDGDGIFYSYSIFDSISQLQAWANRVFIVPTAPQRKHRLVQLAAPNGLLVALREPSGPGWAGR